MIPRILVGTAEIANAVYNLTKGFRELGFKTDSLIIPQQKNPFYTKNDYTITTMDYLDGTALIGRPDGRMIVRPGQKFINFIKQYDIFVFVAGSSLLPCMLDLPILRQLGKIIISRQCGTEVRDTELANLYFEAHGHHYPYYERDVSTEKIHCSGEKDLININRYHPALANKLHNTRITERFAHVISSGAPSQTLGVRPYFQSGPVFDSRQFICRVPKRKVPVILHAPSNPLYKRTKLILQTLQELQDEGLAFHVDLLQNVPHEQVRKRLTEADIVIDQLSCGSGFLAYEGMASGCAVIGGHDGIASPLPRNRPVFHVTAETLKEKIRKVVEDVGLRTYLAEKGWEFINRGIGSPASVAAYLLQALDRARHNDADLYPTLFTEKAFIPEGEMIPEYLKVRTLKVLQTYGASPEINLYRLVRENLLPQGCENLLANIPRWNISRLRKEGPWVMTGPNATYGLVNPASIQKDGMVENIPEYAAAGG